MKNLQRIARFMIVGGIASVIIAVILNLLELPIPALGLGGLITLFLGVLIKAWGDRQAILMVFGGGILSIIGAAGVSNQIQEGSSGVAIYGGVPIPMVILFALGALAGLYFFVQGLIRIWK